MSNLPYISEDLIKSYQGHISNSSSVSTSKRKMASLKKFFSWAQGQGHIESNPLENKESLKTNLQLDVLASNNPIVNVSSSKHHNITNIIRLALGTCMVILAFLIVRNLEIPIPFIFTPASENKNLVTISGGSPSPTVIPSILPSILPSPSITPTPTATNSGEFIVGPTNTPAPIPSMIPTNGILTLEGSNPAIKGVGGLLVSSENISLSAIDGSDGDIVINPDGSGNLNLIFEGSAGNQVNAIDANLKTGSLYYGYVGNNNTSYNLLLLQSGSSSSTKFSVSASGDTFIKGDITNVKNINLTGDLKTGGVLRLSSDGKLANIINYNQTSGLFQVSQGAPDYASFNKTLSSSTGAATADNLIVTLDESLLPTPSNRDSLVVSRKSGQSDAYAIYVPEGNVKFNGDLGITGNFTAVDGTFNDRLYANSIASTYFELVNDEVSHGLTTLVDNNVYTNITALSSTAGGAQWTSVSDSDAGALSIRGVIGSTDPTDSVPTIKLIASKSDGSTGIADLAATETVFQIQNNDNTASFTVEGDGDVVIVGSGTTCTIGDGIGGTSCTSDERLKENIEDLKIGLNEILALKTVEYNWKDKNKSQKKNIGLIAQNVQQVIPQAVNQIQNEFLAVDYSSLVVPLIKSVQELNEKIPDTINFVAENISAGSIIVEKLTINTTLKVADIFTDSIVANVVRGTSFVAENISAGTIIATDTTIKGTLNGARFIAENIQAGTLTVDEITAESITSLTASVDNLLISTKLVSPKIKTASIDPINEGESINISTDTIVEGKTETQEILVNNDAKVTGTLYADRVVANTYEGEDIEQIENLLNEMEESREMIKQAQGWESYIASGSAKLDEIATSKLYVTEQAVFNDTTVTGSINLSGFVISANEADGASLNTLAAPLSLQSLALAPIEIMAGKITINTSGDIEFKGNVSVAGDLTVKGYTNAEKLSIQKLIVATNQTSSNTDQAVEGVIETNATAGNAKISTNKSEVVIRNPEINDQTLVYVTPTSETQNQVLFVKSKESGKFVVGFLNPTQAEVSFNWWIIDAK